MLLRWMAVGILAGCSVVSAADDSLNVPPVPGVHELAGRGRALLAGGRVREAERIARQALPSGGDEMLVLWGEILFRRGNFCEAGKAFQQAIEINPQNARGWWGLGRIEELEFRRERARDLFARAHRLDSRDTDIMLSHLDGVADPASRALLLRNVIALSRTSDPERAEQAAAQLEIDRRLAGRPRARLVSGYRAYRIPLGGYHPSGATQNGLTVTVRVNGGRSLHLVLDTGARGILIEGRAAKGLELRPVVESRIGGFGESHGGDSHLMLARSLDIGEMAFEDCLIQVGAAGGTPGADGILGTGLFEAFRMRVDPHAHAMDLTPPFDGATSPAPARVVGLKNLILMKTTALGRDGWFLLDTGASFSSVARELAPGRDNGDASIVGVRGVLSGAFRMGPLSLSAGGRTLVDLAPVSMDLTTLSRREGVEISGVLGYSALGVRPFTVDFRHGTVVFE
ncbi:MAG TPA: aspartyl protease family protein [Candidatus Solibacter sp.]|nr:aspartyl protease family protein [Candidatus Solibacter sp.]